MRRGGVCRPVRRRADADFRRSERHRPGQGVLSSWFARLSFRRRFRRSRCGVAHVVRRKGISSHGIGHRSGVVRHRRGRRSRFGAVGRRCRCDAHEGRHGVSGVSLFRAGHSRCGRFGARGSQHGHCRGGGALDGVRALVAKPCFKPAIVGLRAGRARVRGGPFRDLGEIPAAEHGRAACGHGGRVGGRRRAHDGGPVVSRPWAGASHQRMGSHDGRPAFGSSVRALVRLRAGGGDFSLGLRLQRPRRRVARCPRRGVARALAFAQSDGRQNRF